MTDPAFVELLTEVSKYLDQLSLEYAVTGSVASSLFGEPHNTQDIDICLHMTKLQAAHLDRILPPRFFRSQEALQEAVERCSMANLVDMKSGIKVDLSVLSSKPYFDMVLERRVRVPYREGGPEFWLVTPEDIILMKLLWRKDTRSQKQWDNALSVVHSMGMRLDWEYMRSWGDQLSIGEDLQRLMREAGI